ncbi:3' exoribonuclease [Pochonia chlamydosporia 170]|uniref:3' exoribonuclease n=1 Tax=Pochonia chlamydosporia 170 TaxID=1380566 RepID=A0A179F9Z2_METCM|nr:3' exoribonuclease [Pochonia chlamydosporia 170]OAQ62258.1 3' exoribonuclease [Pochonia chlamydosporia 170]
MSDRRRINGPGGPTNPPIYDEDLSLSPVRNRNDSDARPFYLKTGVTPSASGSAYFEIGQSTGTHGFGMKFTCTVHGPRSLPRSAPFSPHMVLSTHVKYAPFATRYRRGYLRDASERDLSIHLEAALRGAVIVDRWPKSGVDVVVTVVEGDMSRQATIDQGLEDWNTMFVLSGCITVAAAAIADAGIDCVDVVAGGVAALVVNRGNPDEQAIVMDPVVSEHDTVLAACCVAYLPTRNEITNLWYKGSFYTSELTSYQSLVSNAVLASKATGKTMLMSLNEAIPSV